MASGKRIGKKSQASNDFLEPLAPINVVGTDVGTGRAFNNGAVSVAFSLPALSPAATSYTVTASTGQTATGASSPLVVTGIASAATPTFTVTATNAAGTSAASTASAAVTVTTVPATPGAPSAVTNANLASDTVSWTAPATGGSAITGYTWASSDAKTGTTASTSAVVAQEQGTAQTYNVYATNANGNSLTSANSGSVTTFSFTPFAFTPFAFTPYAFTPYSFTPFAFTPYAFTPYSFTPFAFTPYAFTPYAFTPFAFTPFSFVPAPYSFTPAPYSFTPYSFTPAPYSFTPYSFTPSGGCRGFKPYPYCFCQGTIWAC
jgi:hypothetical protein